MNFPPSLRRGARRLLFPALFFTLAGCAHYQLGTQGHLDFATLYVAPVSNHTVMAQVQAVMSTQIRDAFEKDGRVSLVSSPQAADATLSVTLVDFHRDVAAVREADTGLASKFSLTLIAHCTLRDNRSGKTYFEDRSITVESDVYTDSGQPWSPLTGDQLQAEYNDVPILAESLADKVSHTVLDVW